MPAAERDALLAAAVTAAPAPAAVVSVEAGVNARRQHRHFASTEGSPAAPAPAGERVTRDACVLIEDGRLTAPLAGLRFTESVIAASPRPRRPAASFARSRS